MKRIGLFFIALMTSTSALAQAVPPSPAYQECTSLASTDPTAALAKADAWIKIDTSVSAQHCRAMALYGLRRFAEAGDALAAVRDSVTRDTPSTRSYIARQASQAYANANQIDRALAILSNQIEDLSNTRGDNVALAKMTSETLVERAKLYANYGKLNDAAKDLDHAISLTPLNDAVLLERAQVFEKLNDKALARHDAENALKLNASNGAAREMVARLGGSVAAPAPASDIAAHVAPQDLAPAAGHAKATHAKPAATHKKPAAAAPTAVAQPTP